MMGSSPYVVVTLLCVLAKQNIHRIKQDKDEINSYNHSIGHTRCQLKSDDFWLVKWFYKTIRQLFSISTSFEEDEINVMVKVVK